MIFYLDLGCDVFVLFFYIFLFQKLKTSVLLNTKYMKIMMQIKHYQRLKQLNKYVYVCISLSTCGDDHKHCCYK